MLYFAISPSAINPHCGARPASALACLPQVGIQLGAGAISFSATVCPPQSFVKKAPELSRRRKQWARGKYKKNKGRRGRDMEKKMVDGWAQRRKGWKKILQNCLSAEVRARPLMGDSIEQNMYWRQRLCLLPVPFQ